MKIVTSPIYKCNKCKKTFETSPEDFDSPETYSEARNMGREIQFVWTYEFSCSNCDNPIEIIIEGYEYPEGFFNYEDTTSDGCILIQKASLETEHSDI